MTNHAHDNGYKLLFSHLRGVEDLKAAERNERVKKHGDKAMDSNA